MKKRQRVLEILGITIVISFAIFGFVVAIWLLVSKFTGGGAPSLFSVEEPDFEVELLSINEYSRPGIARENVEKIVIHYTANPGSTAQQNRDYFEGLQSSHFTKASCHFIIGLDGEIIQCIPTGEVAYGVGGEENFTTISIEVCHPYEDGQFTEETYKSLVHMTAWLCGMFDLTSDDVIRHYDITGKDCPKYYVENKDAWNQFISDVEDYIKEFGVPKE